VTRTARDDESGHHGNEDRRKRLDDQRGARRDVITVDAAAKPLTL
jgi:hypothetical protein